MKKSFIGTENDLDKYLQGLLDKGKNIINVKFISYLYSVNSFDSDNEIKVFIIEIDNNDNN